MPIDVVKIIVIPIIRGGVRRAGGEAKRADGRTAGAGEGSHYVSGARS